MTNYVKKFVGKSELFMEESHMLPFYYNSYPYYDRALPKIAKHIKELDKKLVVIDIGANIGDTVCLITQEVVGDFLCIEGDKDYLDVLKKNIKNDIKCKIEDCFCSDQDSVAEILVDRKLGTAKISEKTGNKEKISYNRLDTIISRNERFKKTNLLKIDTDGYELFVLNGAVKTLRETKPVIFFEFTPALYIEKKQKPLEIIKILTDCGYQDAIFYDNFGRVKELVNLGNTKRIQELIDLIDNKNIYYYDILTYHPQGPVDGKVLFQKAILENLLISQKLESKREENKVEHASIKTTDKNLEQNYTNTLNDYNNLLAQFNIINSSRGWKLINYLRKNRLIRVSWRIIRYVVNQSLGILKAVKTYLIHLKHRFTPRPKRIINSNSNKIVFVDHSYHTKTKSSDQIFLDELKKKFKITHIYDGSWNGENSPDFSFIDKSYLAVIFWQSIPNPEVLKKIKNENIILIPMYDSHVNWGLSEWLPYRDYKIFCFSTTIYKLLKKYDFQVSYVQFFVKPFDFTPGDPENVFFWQRNTQVNIKTVIDLIGHYKISINFLNCIDPNHNSYQPTKEQIKEYSIKEHNWFKNQDDMFKQLKQNGIYFAPREYEGIGLGFLEAMAMGKAVIAVNNPTMNEYIVDGFNGYLFDLNNIQKLNLKDIKRVQKNTFDFMKNGYVNWLRQKKNIIKFIYSR